jgi:hypothetical protein
MRPLAIVAMVPVAKLARLRLLAITFVRVYKGMLSGAGLRKPV